MKILISFLILFLSGCTFYPSSNEMRERISLENKFSANYEGKVISQIQGIYKSSGYDSSSSSSVRIIFEDGSELNFCPSDRYRITIMEKK